jgi:hypothetical protein
MFCQLLSKNCKVFKKKYSILFDGKQIKEKRLTTITELRDDFSKIIFYIDPIKTMNFKFQKLIEANSLIFASQEEASSKKENTVSKISEMKSYFDILINSLAQQNTEPKEKNGKR